MFTVQVIRELKVHQQQSEDLHFTRASDIYAFGTVWYELLTGEWPWKEQPPEAIIWQVGKGIRPTLANLQASREVKDILVQCWLFNPKDRPDFPSLAQTLERLPKKRLARSPSHPIHLSRSAEALFWDSRLQPSSRDFLEILDVTAHPFPEPPVPLPTSQKMWSWQQVIDISQSTL